MATVPAQRPAVPVVSVNGEQNASFSRSSPSGNKTLMLAGLGSGRKTLRRKQIKGYCCASNVSEDPVIQTTSRRGAEKYNAGKPGVMEEGGALLNVTPVA